MEQMCSSEVLANTEVPAPIQPILLHTPVLVNLVTPGPTAKFCFAAPVLVKTEVLVPMRLI